MPITLHRRPLPPPRRLPPRGFTLIELCVVIGIIVLAMSLILPIVNTLNFNRSLANAQGQIAAYLANVRSDAMRYQQPLGMCVYIDPVTQQVTLAEVQFIILPGSDIANAVDIAGVRNPTQGTYQPYRDTLTLGKNVGVALNANPNSTTVIGIPGAAVVTPIVRAVDRLQRMGIIMFDASGCLTNAEYCIPATGGTPPNALSQQLFGNSTVSFGVTATAPIFLVPPIPTTCNGFYLYDRSQYAAQTITANPQYAKAIVGNPFSDADLYYSPYETVAPPVLVLADSNCCNKAEEEDWIFANGISLTLNPFDGMLIKGK